MQEMQKRHELGSFVLSILIVNKIENLQNPFWVRLWWVLYIVVDSRFLISGSCKTLFIRFGIMDKH